jgi:hypothetical protein
VPHGCEPPPVREMTIFMREWLLVCASCVLPTRIFALKPQLKTLFLSGFAALVIAAAPARAAEPSASGLWQKQDEAGRPIGWFLFVERNGTYFPTLPPPSSIDPL